MKKVYCFLAIALAVAVPVSGANSTQSMLIMCGALFIALLWGMKILEDKQK